MEFEKWREKQQTWLLAMSLRMDDFDVTHLFTEMDKLLEQSWQASASFTRKQVVEELGPWLRHKDECASSDVTLTEFINRGVEPRYLAGKLSLKCTCSLDAKIREGG